MASDLEFYAQRCTGKAAECRTAAESRAATGTTHAELDAARLHAEADTWERMATAATDFLAWQQEAVL